MNFAILKKMIVINVHKESFSSKDHAMMLVLMAVFKLMLQAVSYAKLIAKPVHLKQDVIPLVKVLILMAFAYMDYLMDHAKILALTHLFQAHNAIANVSILMKFKGKFFLSSKQILIK